ncbi:DNA cytosine methyltransferase [Lepagella muris]|uniref:DNA (Cytosine-5-)-methyltransferase n=2 Tax=Muribaculaceae TaxID=2005473 RepID=A0AC61RMZ5_9BACT|nr:DNA (cytosine-5-)-methyltransferase [Lepagella muris]TGY80011.1 DNA (cytosine-5-)-methyltransferase [Lepagella muris]TKC64866.1 DNA (cytosine-5-)-methyltransferase [Bacteroidales bacterium]
MEHKFNYNWTLKDANFSKDKGVVFSCFACGGGGATMGYKLAGYDVIGCNEIDPRVMSLYEQNHHPRYAFLEPIQTFKDRTAFPDALYNLDILDGSPPCSAFSIAGSREEAWGVEKKFREGQATQILDTLFFDFIELAHKLQPKVVIAENVKGLLQGDAKKYVQRIYAEFDAAGYYCQHWLLDGSNMGVPQRRERVFFVCLRKDLIDFVPVQYNLFDVLPRLTLDFHEPPITCEDAGIELGDPITTPCYAEEYDRLKAGLPKKYLQCCLYPKTVVHPTLIAGYRAKASPMPDWGKQWLSTSDICKISSFPQDYDFGTQKPEYVCGMSVPPLMIAQIATQVYEQWLTRINQVK